MSKFSSKEEYPSPTSLKMMTPQDVCRSIPGHKIGGLSAHPLPKDVNIEVIDDGLMIFTGNISDEMREANAKAVAEHSVGIAVRNGFGQGTWS